MNKGMKTGLFDKNGTPIKIGDKTRLVLDDGEVREFDVCFKTTKRTVVTYDEFEEEYADVEITGVVFCWDGYDLFPCVGKNGISDTSKMEVIKSYPTAFDVDKLLEDIKTRRNNNLRCSKMQINTVSKKIAYYNRAVEDEAIINIIENKINKRKEKNKNNGKNKIN